MKRLVLSFTGALLTLAPVMIGGSALADPVAGPTPRNKAVVELFTSQGCSSCPPADALLGRLAEEPELVALSFAVDYWDYLGWRDTLGSPANSERQRNYARARGDGRVYTPQIVVDGVAHVNGADENAVFDAVKIAEKRLAAVKVPVSMRAEGDALVINVGAAPEGSDRRTATVWLAIAKEVEKVAVARGENHGRELPITIPCASSRRSACGMARR